jgi:hypothetical protein
MFDDGVIFKWIVVALFAIEALVVVVYGLHSTWQLLRLLGDVKFLVGLAILVYVIALLVATLLAVIILGYRGVYEAANRQAAKFSVLSLWAKVLRVNGEAALFYLIFLAPAGCLAIWLSGATLTDFLPFPPAFMATGTFSLGVAVLLGGLLHALVIVFLAYLVAEICELLPAIGADVAAIRAAKR